MKPVTVTGFRNFPITQSRKTSSTIRDVATQAGVSVATVSRYINHSAPVSDEISDRIQAAMQALRYTPNQVARQLATHKTYAVGLLLSDIAGDFFTPMLEGLEQAVSAAGFNLLVSSTQRMTDRPPVGPHNADGVVIFTKSLPETWLKFWSAEKFPMVLVHQTSPAGLDIPCVTVENKAASRKIVEHLIQEHRRRRIVFVRGSTGHEDASWREMGYRDALSQAGLPYDPDLVVEGDFDRHTAMRSMNALLASGVQFDAVFAADDKSALGVMEALKQAGISIPEQVALVGFDDLSFAPYLFPALTTIRAPIGQVGETAAQQLIRRIAGLPVEKLVLLPTEMVVRNSCGCT